MKEVLKRSITQHAAALEAGEYSSLELTRAFLENIDPDINAYITVSSELALKQAAESDERRKEERALGLLDGIPYVAKDNIAVRGLRLTCGSKMLENYVDIYLIDFKYQQRLDRIPMRTTYFNCCAFLNCIPIQGAFFIFRKAWLKA